MSWLQSAGSDPNRCTSTQVVSMHPSGTNGAWIQRVKENSAGVRTFLFLFPNQSGERNGSVRRIDALKGSETGRDATVAARHPFSKGVRNEGQTQMTCPKEEHDDAKDPNEDEGIPGANGDDTRHLHSIWTRFRRIPQLDKKQRSFGTHPLQGSKCRCLCVFIGTHTAQGAVRGLFQGSLGKSMGL
eukprot:scaffold626_cov337-Pavlova_lutheri.AAC.50